MSLLNEQLYCLPYLFYVNVSTIEYKFDVQSKFFKSLQWQWPQDSFPLWWLFWPCLKTLVWVCHWDGLWADGHLQGMGQTWVCQLKDISDRSATSWGEILGIETLASNDYWSDLSAKFVICLCYKFHAVFCGWCLFFPMLSFLNMYANFLLFQEWNSVC